MLPIYKNNFFLFHFVEMLDIVKTQINSFNPIQIDNTGHLIFNISDYSNCINEWNKMKMDDGGSYLYLPNLILPVVYHGCMIRWYLGRFGNDIHVRMWIVNNKYNKDISYPVNLTMKLKVIIIIYLFSLFIHF